MNRETDSRRPQRAERSRGPSKACRTPSATFSSQAPHSTFPQTILVTSPCQARRSDDVGPDLARTLAKGGLRMILVDGGLQRPMVRSFFGVPTHRAPFPVSLLGHTRWRTPSFPHGDTATASVSCFQAPEHQLFMRLFQTEHVEQDLAELSSRGQHDHKIGSTTSETKITNALVLADTIEAVVDRIPPRPFRPPTS